MKWQDLYPSLKNLKNKASCVNFAQQCADNVKANQNCQTYDQLRIARIKATTILEREKFHILLHLIEAQTANNYISAAGHAARCGEALARIDKNLLPVIGDI